MDIVEERVPVVNFGGRLWHRLHFSGSVDHSGFRAGHALRNVVRFLVKLCQEPYLNAVVHLALSIDVELPCFADLDLLLEVSNMGAVMVSLREEVLLHGVNVPVGEFHAAELAPYLTVVGHLKAVDAACVELFHSSKCFQSLAMSHSLVFHF